MPRVYTQKARKERVCGRCGDTIHKGDMYRSCAPGFRAATQFRCNKTMCYFRQSELCTNNMKDAYAAQEGASEDLEAIAISETTEAESFFEDEVKPILEQCAEGIRESAQLYQEASDAWRQGEGNEEWTEKAETLESAANEVEDWEADEFDPDGEQTAIEYCEAVVEAAVEHVNGVSIE